MVSLLIDCKRVIIQYDNYEDNCLIFGGHQKILYQKFVYKLRVIMIICTPHHCTAKYD